MSLIKPHLGATKPVTGTAASLSDNTLAYLSQSLLIDEPCEDALATLIFAHGAGAPMDSDFMAQVTAILSAKGYRVVRFEFPYMHERRQTGKRRPPNRAPELLNCFEALLEDISSRFSEPIILMGKSMGGRMATLLADLLLEPQLSKLVGIVALGYPFHPQAKPQTLRTAHLEDFALPLLIVQGERDKLGSKDEVAGYHLDSSIECYWLEDGDHDLKPRVKSGFSHNQHINTACDVVSARIQKWLS